MSGRRRYIPAEARVDILPVGEWHRLAHVVMGMEAEIENRDDMEAVFRSVKRDARLRHPELIQMQHFRLVLTLVQIGRRYQAKHG